MLFFVLTEPAAEEVPSFTSVPPGVMNGVTGSNVTMECAANGNPAPVFSWNKEGGHLPRTRHRIVLGKHNMFTEKLVYNFYLQPRTFICIPHLRALINRLMLICDLNPSDEQQSSQ